MSDDEGLTFHAIVTSAAAWRSRPVAASGTKGHAMTPFIVAELSKNWIDGVALVDNGLLCQLFEQCIEHNRQRGYRLHSFQLHRMMTGERELNETIIAVFEQEHQP